MVSEDKVVKLISVVFLPATLVGMFGSMFKNSQQMFSGCLLCQVPFQ